MEEESSLAAKSNPGPKLSQCFSAKKIYGHPRIRIAKITKASEASWSYSCDSKVSFDRVQILTPDLSGRRPPPPPLRPSPLLPSPLPSPPSPPPCLPPTFPPSPLLPLRKFDSVLSSLFGMRLALRILRPHSLTLTVSLSHCLTVSLSLSSLSSLSHLSHLFLISLISLSSLSLSSLSLVFPSLFSLFSRRRIRAKSHI